MGVRGISIARHSDFVCICTDYCVARSSHNCTLGIVTQFTRMKLTVTQPRKVKKDGMHQHPVLHRFLCPCTVCQSNERHQVQVNFKMPGSNEHHKGQPGKPFSYRHPAATECLSNEGQANFSGDHCLTARAAYIVTYHDHHKLPLLHS